MSPWNVTESASVGSTRKKKEKKGMQRKRKAGVGPHLRWMQTRGPACAQILAKKKLTGNSPSRHRPLLRCSCIDLAGSVKATQLPRGLIDDVTRSTSCWYRAQQTQRPAAVGTRGHHRRRQLIPRHHTRWFVRRGQASRKRRRREAAKQARRLPAWTAHPAPWSGR